MVILKATLQLGGYQKNTRRVPNIFLKKMCIAHIQIIHVILYTNNPKKKKKKKKKKKTMSFSVFTNPKTKKLFSKWPAHDVPCSMSFSVFTNPKTKKLFSKWPAHDVPCSIFTMISVLLFFFWGPNTLVGLLTFGLRSET
jgi:hypothetical protein